MEKIKQLINSTFTWLNRYISPALFAVLGIGIATSILLFVQPINGLGDNGEYFRVLNSNGLYRVNGENYDNVSYFVKEFSIMRYFNESSTHFVSTQQFFITVAIWLNKLFYSQTVFDLRFLGFLYLSCFLVYIYFLVRGLTEGVSIKKSYLISLLVIFILGDSSYTIYFNSFYTEATSYLLAVGVLAFSVYFYRVTKPRTWLRRIVLVILAQVTVLLIGSNRQEYLLIIGIIISGLGFFAYLHEKYQRLSLTAFFIALVGFTTLASFIVPNDTYERDLYHSMTRGVMKDTKVPDKRMSEGGINPQYGLQRGRSYFEEYSPVSPNSEQMKKEFLNKTSFVWILFDYLNYPSELWQGLNSAVPNVYLVKPNNVGNFEKLSGQQPLAQSKFFMIYNRIKASFFPKSFAFYLLLGVIVIGLYSIGLYNGIKKLQPRLIFRFFLMSGIYLNLLVIFVGTVIIDGDSDLVRHLFLVSVFLDFLLLQVVSDVIGKRMWQDENPILLEEGILIEK